VFRLAIGLSAEVERGGVSLLNGAPETTLRLLWRLLFAEMKWKSSDAVALV
jgi:hypothetical protein